MVVVRALPEFNDDGLVNFVSRAAESMYFLVFLYVMSVSVSVRYRDLSVLIVVLNDGGSVFKNAYTVPSSSMALLVSASS